MPSMASSTVAQQLTTRRRQTPDTRNRPADREDPQANADSAGSEWACSFRINCFNLACDPLRDRATDTDFFRCGELLLPPLGGRQYNLPSSSTATSAFWSAC